MSITRKNTIIVDFGVLPVRPDAGKVQEFLEKEIQLQLSDVENIQLHNIRNCVFIEVKDSETAARYQRLHNNRHVVQYCDKAFRIPVYIESEAVPVRVHDLPPAMKHTTVIDFLSQYGEVMSVTRERWKNYFPGVYNGVRILHMKIKHPIPSYVTISGHQTLITHPGQLKTCKQCQKTSHPGQRCVEAMNSSTTTTNTQKPTIVASQTTSSIDENRSLLNLADFPPISQPPTAASEKQQTKTIPPTATDDQTPAGDHIDDGDGDATDSSSSGTMETNNKRRRSARLANERKKLCPSQVFLNDHQSIDNRSQDGKKVVFSEVKSSKSNENLNKDLNCNLKQTDLAP